MQDSINIDSLLVQFDHNIRLWASKLVKPVERLASKVMAGFAVTPPLVSLSLLLLLLLGRELAE